MSGFADAVVGLVWSGLIALGIATLAGLVIWVGLGFIRRQDEPDYEDGEGE